MMKCVLNSTLDFTEMYQNMQPLFDAPHGDLTTLYMDVPASFDVMIELKLSV